MNNEFKENRNFMKSSIGLIEVLPDQRKGIPAPDRELEFSDNAIVFELPPVKDSNVVNNNFYDCLVSRRSKRVYNYDEQISLRELSYLLYTTNGVQKVLKNEASLRTVPSGGGRHAFDTYLIINNVRDLESGIYRYNAYTHKLSFLKKEDEIKKRVTNLTFGQKFVGNAQVIFLWVCIPERAEWRYHFNAHKAMLIDVGHICQNLYLSCESLGLGTCAILAYEQAGMDELLGVDGENAFTTYLASVGKI